jgi:Tol biopolymer transport system component
VADISANGRYITFHANDSTLANPTCLAMLDCVYRHDRQTGVTELITYEPNGNPSGGHTYQPAISGDGNRIAFLSENGFLDGNTSNNETNVYLWTGLASLTNRVYIPIVIRN